VRFQRDRPIVVRTPLGGLHHDYSLELRGVSFRGVQRESDMNIIYKGTCEQCQAEVIIILRHVHTLENLRGQFKRTCMICERSEVTLEVQGFRGDTA
jgi:hypothetical protein